jgi:tRNA threonylcarbamoyladenosine biosynthesis protein TsaE
VGPGDVLALDGPLGAGKTFFAAALCAALGVPRTAVDSPSFVLLNEYEGRRKGTPLPIYHFDAYRLQGEGAELAEAGFLDERQGDGVCIVEWAERVADFLPRGALRIRLWIEGETRRRLTFAGWPDARLAALRPWREAPA